MLETRAYAKINLALDVLGGREDGYHDLRMVMQTVSLCDELTIEPGREPGIRVQTNLEFLPNNDKNLAAIAARKFWKATGLPEEDLLITIHKAVPVCAGMAGGSSDGAAVLRVLNERCGTALSPERLAEIGAQVGSDVPYCVLGGTALAEGRGERLTPLPPLPDCHIVLCKPPFPISTPELFHSIDGVKLRCHPDTKGMVEALERRDLTGVCQRLYNVFEDVLPSHRQSQVREIKHSLLEYGALGACMSGTGPTVFGIFADRAAAARAYDGLKWEWPETYLTTNIR